MKHQCILELHRQPIGSHWHHESFFVRPPRWHRMIRNLNDRPESKDLRR